MAGIDHDHERWPAWRRHGWPFCGQLPLFGLLAAARLLMPRL